MAVVALLFGLISFGCELGRLTCCKGAAGVAGAGQPQSQLSTVTVVNVVNPVKEWSAAAQPWQAQQLAPVAAPALPPGWSMQSNGTAGGTFFIAPDGSRHWQVPQLLQRPAY